MQGIYPTLIIIIVALDKSEIEKESVMYSIAMDHGAVLPPNASISSADMGVCEDTVCTQSVILIETHTNDATPISNTEWTDGETNRAESMA